MLKGEVMAWQQSGASPQATVHLGGHGTRSDSPSPVVAYAPTTQTSPCRLFRVARCRTRLARKLPLTFET